MNLFLLTMRKYKKLSGLKPIDHSVIGDDCPSWSLSTTSFEFGMAMPFASSLPHLRLYHHLVAYVNSRQNRIIILHYVPLLCFNQLSPVYD